MSDPIEYTDEVLIARAIENGWKQCINVTDEWPGRPGSPFTGWNKGTSARHMEPGREYTTWVGKYPNRHQITYIGSWAHDPREAFSHEDRCQECGKWVEYGGYGGYGGYEPGTHRDYCWNCNHWLAHVKKYGQPDPQHRHAVIDRPDGTRTIYTIGTQTTPSQHCGHGGAWFTIRTQTRDQNGRWTDTTPEALT